MHALIVSFLAIWGSFAHAEGDTIRLGRQLLSREGVALSFPVSGCPGQGFSQAKYHVRILSKDTLAWISSLQLIGADDSVQTINVHRTYSGRVRGGVSNWLSVEGGPRCLKELRILGRSRQVGSAYGSAAISLYLR